MRKGTIYASVGVSRIDVLGQCLLVMALFAEGLPVALIPEQFLVSTGRNDVIHHRSPDVLATLGSRSCCFWMERQMLLTVEPRVLPVLGSQGVGTASSVCTAFLFSFPIEI